MKPKLNPNALAASISGAVFGAGLAFPALMTLAMRDGLFVN
mgnify:CR=1 FL=1